MSSFNTAHSFDWLALIQLGRRSSQLPRVPLLGGAWRSRLRVPTGKKGAQVYQRIQQLQPL